MSIAIKASDFIALPKRSGDGIIAALISDSIKSPNPLWLSVEKNKFYDLHLMTGLKLSSDLVLLKAGRILRDTRQWNPMVFAFVYD